MVHPLLVNLHLTFEQNDFVNLGNYTDLLAFSVIMMTGDQGKDFIVRRQHKCVQDIGTAKILFNNPGLETAAMVMDNIFGPD